MKNLDSQKFSSISISQIKKTVQSIDDLNKFEITIFKPGLIEIKSKKFL